MNKIDKEISTKKEIKANLYRGRRYYQEHILQGSILLYRQQSIWL